MPLTRVVADALGVVTVCLVAILVLLGVLCILYSLYLRSLIHGQALAPLTYFSGPWIIKILFIILAMWWGACEIARLSLLRHKGKFLGKLTHQWQQNVCKGYIISNLGFSEPCLFITLTFLLRASLQIPGALSRMWNRKTTGFVLLYCLPMCILQITVISVVPKYKEELRPRIPSYFFEAASSPRSADDIVHCTYPLLSTILTGLFATVLTAYFFWLGRRILHLVISMRLRKRVYALIVSISGLFPLRAILLGLSILADPGDVLFDAISFLSFLLFFCSMGMIICIVIYLPIADSLSLRRLQIDSEAGRQACGGYDESSSLIGGRSPVEGSARNSAGQGSISFHHAGDDDGVEPPLPVSDAGFVELNLFNSSMHSSPPGSPSLDGWPATGGRRSGGGG
ncbi:uncharacterized protein LOC127255621 [Andrographis paniculata]|uniref:uncharacterized protein LOC127255621 n=1 Tax=Andrographis paniculata TaxID=175694 RepID=UPI0021E94CE3|nr:uncharacterized protein LOC127255621 [Andrographis paniculata]